MMHFNFPVFPEFQFVKNLTSNHQMVIALSRLNVCPDVKFYKMTIKALASYTSVTYELSSHLKIV